VATNGRGDIILNDLAMRDLEFEILDELYFLITYQNLAQRVSVSEKELRNVLGNMVSKRWVRCFRAVDEDLEWEDVDFEHQYTNYHYLASKAGLLAHNSR